MRLTTFGFAVLAAVIAMSGCRGRVAIWPASGNQTVDDISEMLTPIRREVDVPALGAAVVRDDHLVAIGTSGVRRHGDPIAVTTDDRFQLGSCGKALTATLAAVLVDDEIFHWDTTLVQAFPSLAAAMGDHYRSVTLLQVLAHRSGLPTYLNRYHPKLWRGLRKAKGPIAEQRFEFAKTVLLMQPDEPPGTADLYSNAGYIVLGSAMEQATGQTWEELMREHIFGPLGMESCGFGAPATPGKIDQPWGHDWERERPWKRPFPSPVSPDSPGAAIPRAMGPAGSMHCSLRDWAKFVTLHLAAARGRPSLLRAESFARLHTPIQDDGFALGWQVLGWNPQEPGWESGTALGHSGSFGIYYSYAWLQPAANTGIVVAVNAGYDRGIKAVTGALKALRDRYARLPE